MVFFVKKYIDKYTKKRNEVMMDKKYNFYYLKKDKSNPEKPFYTIPQKCKVDFEVMGEVNQEDVEKVMTFAWEMAFGKGYHKRERNGGDEVRKDNKIFANTFQGKLAEYVVYNYLRRYGLEVEEPDLSVFGKNEWDNGDIDCNGRHISVKSTKHFGEMLFLETENWDEQGCYTHSDDGKISEFDYNILVRIRPSCEDLLKNAGCDLQASGIPETVINSLRNQTWKYCMPRYISKEELIYLIKNNFVIKKGQFFNKKRMDADNYYVKSYDMHQLSEIINELRER